MLHRFFEKHADKVGKELLSGAKPGEVESLTPEAEASAVSGKLAWNALCAALVELDQPLDSPRLSNLRSHEFREYLDLMSRYSHRDTSTVRELFTASSSKVIDSLVLVPRLAHGVHVGSRSLCLIRVEN